MSPQREERRDYTQSLSFLGTVDEGAINCKSGAPFWMVYISTASAIQHGFDVVQRWIRTK